MLNTSPAEPAANAVTVATGPDGDICLVPSLNTDVIADINGLFVTG